MAKKKLKTIVAGSMVWQVLYTPPAPSDRGETRRRKQSVSSEAQQRMNAKYSWQKLALLLAANYVPGDLVVCLTYADEFLPESHKQCEARLKKFRASVNAARKEAGKPRLKMFWNFEHEHGDKRWHHHTVINATGNDYEVLQACWPYGQIEIQLLEVNHDRNYESLARYMCKERPERLGQRGWSYTRGVAKPEVDTQWVDADTVIQPPKGAIVFADARERTDFASYHFLKYYAPGWNTARRRTVTRRRTNKRK